MFIKALNFIFILLEVVLIFNLLIVVHEIGHFLAAKWRGLYIEGFGIWFGKPLWEKKINGVTYSLGSIPAGGFVKLPQLAPMEAMEGGSEVDRDQLPPISALNKIIVAFAGPLFSFGLAFVFAVIVWGIGRPVGEAESTTTIGFVIPDSPAEQAGLLAGDEILEVDGHVVTKFNGMGDSVTWRIVRSEGDTIPIKVKRGSEILTFFPKPLKPERSGWSRKSLRQINILPASTPMVAQVAPGSLADKAGLKPNDLVTAINGQRLLGMMDISEYAAQHPGEPLSLTVRRGAQTLAIPYVPDGATIEIISKNSPAENAGLKIGDRVVGIDGNKIPVANGLTEYVQKHSGQTLALDIVRDGSPLQIKVTPVIPVGEKKPRIGVSWVDDDGIAWDGMGQFAIVHPNPVEQIHAGVMAIANTLDAVISKKSDIKLEHMNGPVTIMRAYYMMFESKEGWRLALWFSVVLNVNLALINLLPIPVLDGGHILLAIVESIRRKPVNIKVLETIQTACALLIIGFMLYIGFFDVQDLNPWRDKQSDVKFSAQPAASPLAK